MAAKRVQEKDKANMLRQMTHDPSDYAVAFYQIAEAKYGIKALVGLNNYDPRKLAPLKIVEIQTGLYDQKPGVIDRVRVTNIPADFNISPGGFVECEVERSKQEEAESFLNSVDKHLRTSSIYRGQAITFQKQFLDLSAISLDKITYNQLVLKNLQTHVWTFIEKLNQAEGLGMKPQRKILFDGPYGAGKTLAALLTAQKAIANGFTFVYLPPPPPDYADRYIKAALNLCNNYAPAILFLEDIDYQQHEEDKDALRNIMTTIDDIVSKTKKVIMIIMTTNHVDKLVAEVQRPGRIDRVIKFGALGSESLVELLKQTIPPHHISLKINWNNVASHCQNYTPAFAQEVATGALLCMLANGSDSVTEEMLIQSAADLQPQFKACSAAAMGFSNGK